MSTPANDTTRPREPGSVPPVPQTSYLSRPGGRIGYDVAGDGPLMVLVPGMGDLRAGYRFLAPALRAAGYRARADQRQARLPPGPLELRGNEPRREDRSWLRAGLTSTGGAAQ